MSSIIIINIKKKSKKNIRIQYIDEDIGQDKINLQITKEIPINQDTFNIGILPIYKPIYIQEPNYGFDYRLEFINVLVHNDKINSINIPYPISDSKLKKQDLHLWETFGITNNEIEKIYYVRIMSKTICVIWLKNSRPLLKFKNELNIPRNNTNCFYIKTYILLIPYNLENLEMYDYYSKNDHCISFQNTNIQLSYLLYPHHEIIIH